MADHVDNRIVKFIGFSDLDGNPVSDWHDDFIDTVGMLCIYESEHKAPGKKFIYYYPNEPDSETLRYFNSTPGEISESGNMLILESGHRYSFEQGDFVSESDFELLWLNVFANDPETASRILAIGGGYVYIS